MTFNRFRSAKRGRRFYFISLCAVVIVLFTVAHWQSYKILVNETRDKFITGLAKNNSNERIVDRFQGVIRTGNAASNVITDAICNSKGFLHSGCHKGICVVGSDTTSWWESSLWLFSMMTLGSLYLNQSEAAYFPALQLSDEGYFCLQNGRSNVNPTLCGDPLVVCRELFYLAHIRQKTVSYELNQHNYVYWSEIGWCKEFLQVSCSRVF